MIDASQPTPEPETEKAKRAQQERELTKAYKRLFSTDDGKTVLADLERKTHWKKGPYAHGIGHGDLSYRCGTQDPVRHIHEHLETELKPLGTKRAPRAAKSAPPRQS